MKCSDCYFFDRDLEQSGICRYAPPRVIINEMNLLETAWPVVRPDDWCGMWKHRKEEKND